ncbi:MAG: ATP-binding protein [Planctomycetes bacterium]|nr:ATP-binding protein [Planctomycetota bacterium]
MPDAISHLGLYRAGLTSPQHRRHITVARSAIVQDTLEILRSNASRRSKHHFLFIGPRGIGKTHLLSLIEDEIVNDSKLAAQYVVARFPEESHRCIYAMPRSKGYSRQAFSTVRQVVDLSAPAWSYYRPPPPCKDQEEQ